MKKVLSCLILVLLTASFVACGINDESPSDESGVSVVDAFGTTVSLSSDARVVSCYGSFSDAWLLSGGRLVGVTDDAVEEQIISADTVSIVGTVKHIDLEQVAALSPDYVILSADLTAHLSLRDALIAAKIPHGYFRMDTFSDYKAMMKQFCAVNGREDLYQKNVSDVEDRIQEILRKIPEGTQETALLLRVYSTGMKAKSDDNLAGVILKELGLKNIVDEIPSLLEDLSVEKILTSDPDYIFALAMGEEKAAEEYLRQNVENNPAWAGISAIQRNRCYLLPKELFHYKPNERWAESYEYLAKIVYPQQFED